MSTAAVWAHPLRIVADVLSLNTDVFRTLTNDPSGWLVGTMVVLAAGLSEALGQSVVLFANRVGPRRFVASLLLTALSYPIGLVLFTLSTFLLADQLFGQDLMVRQVLLIALWSFTPHLFGVFILTPYAGGFISLCLAAWSFGVMTIGIYAVSTLGLTQAALCLTLGWLLWQLLRRSIGWPVVRVARWLRSWVAGESLVTDREGLERLFHTHKEAALAVSKAEARHNK